MLYSIDLQVFPRKICAYGIILYYFYIYYQFYMSL